MLSWSNIHTISYIQSPSFCVLLLKVKFLSEEEEAARAQYKRKQEEFFAETSRLHEALSKERKALAEMNEDKGSMTDHERLGFER